MCPKACNTVLAIVACALATQAGAQAMARTRGRAEAATPDSAPNPFAGFETRVLPNGLKVWFKRAAGYRDVSVSVAVPYGSDQDPPGKEQLAHFVEHMLFTDRPGHTEQEIERGLSERGGTNNATTSSQRTFYFARVERRHGLYALEWMYGIVSPHEMRPDLVERQRDPVLIELRARPRGVSEWIGAHVVDPPLLRPSGFWRREFGLRTADERDVYPWRSVYAITPAELRGFYDHYYVPSRMTLTIIGDLAPDSVWAMVARTFATLPARPAPAPLPPLTDPQRERREYFWGFRSDVRYEEAFKVFDRSARDDLLLVFVSRYLRKRLNEQLRFGERKAAYGMLVNVLRRGRAAQLVISGALKRGELAFAREGIAAELQRLRTGAWSDSAFAAERDALTAQLRSETKSAEALEGWVWTTFHDPDLYADFPDVVQEFSRLSAAEVQAFAARTFVEKHRLFSLTYVVPWPQAVLAAIGALLFALTLRISRSLFVRPLEMTRLRYVTRIRWPAAHRFTLGVAWVVCLVLALRLLFFVFAVVNDRVVTGIDSFGVQAAASAAGAMLGLLIVAAAGAVVPTKVLVFEHGLAVKSLAYRSVFAAWDDVSAASMQRLPEVLRGLSIAQLLRTRVLTPGVMKPALHLRFRDGRGYVLRTRDTSELLAMLRATRAAHGTAGPQPG